VTAPPTGAALPERASGCVFAFDPGCPPYQPPQPNQATAALVSKGYTYDPGTRRYINDLSGKLDGPMDIVRDALFAYVGGQLTSAAFGWLADALIPEFEMSGPTILTWGSDDIPVPYSWEIQPNPWIPDWLKDLGKYTYEVYDKTKETLYDNPQGTETDPGPDNTPR
jgi:hypothetical protein